MNGRPIEISVIIPSFNQAGLLKQCLDSLYDNITGLSWEAIVVDNASQDDSVRLVAAKYPGVRLIRNQANLGFAKAINQGLAEARGSYYLFLNSDVRVLTGALEALKDFLDKHQQVGAVGAKLLNNDRSVQIQGSFTSAGIWRRTKPKKIGFLPFACILLKKAAVERTGRLDENFFFYNEDLDYCRRLIKAGWQIYYLPQAAVIHQGGGSTKQLGPEALFEGYKGGLYLCRKHYPSWVYRIYSWAVFREISLRQFFQKDRAAVYDDLRRRLKDWLAAEAERTAPGAP